MTTALEVTLAVLVVAVIVFAWLTPPRRPRGGCGT